MVPRWRFLPTFCVLHFQRAACFSGFAHASGFAAARRCLRFLVRFLISIFGRPFVKRFALCYRTVVCPVLSVRSICDVGVLWPNGLTDQDETWHRGRPRPGHIVLDGDPAHPKGHAPNFQPMSILAKRSPISATAKLLYKLFQRKLSSNFVIK